MSDPNLTCDLLITSVEINNQHGVGILLQRFFPHSKDFVCLRTTTMYGGDEPFGAAHLELDSRCLTMAETESRLRALLSPYRIRRILCVPYYREEFVHGALAKKITQAPLCVYLMDDQNIYAPHVPDRRVADLLAAADFCLGISPEMCAAYETKFRRPVHLLPPLLTTRLPQVRCYWNPSILGRRTCAMIGNVWTAKRLEQLRALIRAARLQVDWYGNGPKAPWLQQASPDQWQEDGLHVKGFLPEGELIAVLASYPFVLIPTGTLDEDDDNPAFSKLSLPSRLLFLAARVNLPMLVAGSPNTAAGHFVVRSGIGICTSYKPKGFNRAAKKLLNPWRRRLLSHRSQRLAPFLHLENAGQWIWDSLESKQPKPAVFQRLFSTSRPPAHIVASIRTSDPSPPSVNEKLTAEHLPAFVSSRCDHFSLIAPESSASPETFAQELELTRYQHLTASYLLQNLPLAGRDCLFLDEQPPTQASAMQSAGLNLWRVANAKEWASSGFSSDSIHFQPLFESARQTAAVPDRFSAVFSISRCSNFPDDIAQREQFANFLRHMNRPSTWHLHFFNAVLHPSYFWKNPLHDQLKGLLPKNHPWSEDYDFILSSPKTFFMSESAYSCHWLPVVRKPYADFGKPLSLALIWQAPS